MVSNLWTFNAVKTNVGLEARYSGALVDIHILVSHHYQLVKVGGRATEAPEAPGSPWVL